MFRSLNHAAPYYKNAVGRPPDRNTALAAQTSAFLEKDCRECGDDLSTYMAGSASIFASWSDNYGAVSWLGPFLFQLYEYDWCGDDFTSYTSNGSYASLSGGTSWLADWSFFAPT